VHGYPPRAGEPGPRYQESEFPAWNGPATPARPAPGRLPLSAPPGPGGGVVALANPGPGRKGVALAERTYDHFPVFADDDPAAWVATFTGRPLSAPGELGRAAAGPATGETEAGPQLEPERQLEPEPQLEPGITPPYGGEMAATAGRTRAAAARARKAARRKGRIRRRLAAGVCVPAIAAVAALAYFHQPVGHTVRISPVSHGSSATLPVSSPSPTLGTWQHIASRAGDSAPLTLGQLFPAHFVAGGASYTRTAQRSSTNCTRAMFGAKLQAAVRKYKCSQVMRASYLAAGQKLMGTIGVINLADTSGANRVGKVTGSSQFIAQLTAAKGPTRNLTKGTGLEEAEVKGHYLILTWAEFITLHAPKTASERARLRTFSADLISRTANVSLTSRMVTGKPEIP
jgi:hypothetical protein